MADICMCQTADCPLAKRCYRKLAEAEPLRQTYSIFTFIEKDGIIQCDHFWDATTGDARDY